MNSDYLKLRKDRLKDLNDGRKQLSLDLLDAVSSLVADRRSVHSLAARTDLKRLRGSETQSEVAKLAGCAPSDVSRVEAGRLEAYSVERLISVLTAYSSL